MPQRVPASNDDVSLAKDEILAAITAGGGGISPADLAALYSKIEDEGTNEAERTALRSGIAMDTYMSVEAGLQMERPALAAAVAALPGTLTAGEREAIAAEVAALPGTLTAGEREAIAAEVVSQLPPPPPPPPPSDGLPIGFVAEFPAKEIPASWQRIQGPPAQILSGVISGRAATLSPANATTTYVYFPASDRVWRVMNGLLAEMDPVAFFQIGNAATWPAGSSTPSVVCELPSGNGVLVAGSGSTTRADWFDIDSLTFTRIDDMPAAVFGGVMTVFNGQIYWIPSFYEGVNNFTVMLRQNYPNSDWTVIPISLPSNALPVGGSSRKGHFVPGPNGQLILFDMFTQSNLNATPIGGRRYFVINPATGDTQTFITGEINSTGAAVEWGFGADNNGLFVVFATTSSPLQPNFIARMNPDYTMSAAQIGGYPAMGPNGTMGVFARQGRLDWVRGSQGSTGSLVATLEIHLDFVPQRTVKAKKVA